MPEKEYIEREALVKELNKAPANFGSGDIQYGLLIAKGIAEKQPTADVAEVKHGHIIEHQGHEDECYCECSVCKSREVCIDDKFCSECGAKMDRDTNLSNIEV